MGQTPLDGGKKAEWSLDEFLWMGPTEELNLIVGLPINITYKMT
jgi:hypothetical protein